MRATLGLAGLGLSRVATRGAGIVSVRESGHGSIAFSRGTGSIAMQEHGVEGVVQQQNRMRLRGMGRCCDGRTKGGRVG